MKNYRKFLYILTLASGTAFGFQSCSKDWLKPEPLSFYTPEVALSNPEGLYAALTAAERNMRHEFYGDGSPIVTEMVLSDIAVEGTTDKAGPQMDMDISLLPDAQLNNTDFTRVGWYWLKPIKVSNMPILLLLG